LASPFLKRKRAGTGSRFPRSSVQPPFFKENGKIGRRKASFASFSLAKSIDETPSELETFRALDRILSRLPGAVASVNRAASGDDSNASSAKRLGAQDRMIPIMPKRAQSDNSDRAKKQDF